ncbi:MAG TPA: hypothetical protein VMG12_27275 [Polyangiaceae bacterium]|nr:hypothetical protein [Polyangiaceae bacterium]
MLLAGALASTACASAPCPDSQRPADAASWARELRERQPLTLDYRSDISVKRDLRDVIVDVEAARLAPAFHQVMTDAARRFGLIRVDRLPENQGKPFSLGEKFQGRYEVDQAVIQQLHGHLRDWFGDFADSDPVRAWVCQIENGHTSDYGIISELTLSPPPGKEYVLEYRYLDGSPIAGSSRFTVSDITDPDVLARHGIHQGSRLRQLFEYQERTSSFATFFTKGGLRLHNQVVFNQAEQAAVAAGGKVVASDIPVEYQRW